MLCVLFALMSVLMHRAYFKLLALETCCRLLILNHFYHPDCLVVSLM